MPPPRPISASLGTSLHCVPCYPISMSKNRSGHTHPLPLRPALVVILNGTTDFPRCHLGLPSLSRPQVPPFAGGLGSSHLASLHLFLYHRHYDICFPGQKQWPRSCLPASYSPPSSTHSALSNQQFVLQPALSLSRAFKNLPRAYPSSVFTSTPIFILH